MERRSINLSNILGMDLRDNNLDQQHVKEIINLTKDRDGWRLRYDKKDVLDLPAEGAVKAFIVHKNKVVLQINRTLYFYSINGDELGELLDVFNDFIDFDYDLFKTNYPDVYIQIDRTNHKSYVLEFTDRIMCLINDTGNLDQSTELLLHEFDTNTGDFTWCGIIRHNLYDSTTFSNAYPNGIGVNVNISLSSTCVQVFNSGTSILSTGYTVNINGMVRTINSIVNGTHFIVNSALTYTNTNAMMTVQRALNGCTYNSGINRYMIQYDSQNIGTNNEWHEVALLQLFSSLTKETKYILVCGVQNDTHVYEFDWEDFTPYRWSSHKVLKNYNVFKIDGTGDINNYARFMDVIGQFNYIPIYTDWNIFGTGLNSIVVNQIYEYYDVFSSNYYLITSTNSGVYYIPKSGGNWSLMGTNLTDTVYNSKYSSLQNAFYAAVKDKGIKKSPFGDTVTWSDVGIGITDLTAKVIYEETSGDLIVGLDTSSQTTWSSCGIGLGNKSVNHCFKDGSDFYASTISGVYKLTGGSGTWTLFGTGLGRYVYHCFKDGSDFYASTISGVYKLTGGSGTWTQFGIGLSDKNVYHCFKDGSDFYASTNTGVYKLTGGSGTWTLFGTGLDSYVHHCFKDGSDFYASTFSGVYKLTGGSGTWTLFGTGLGDKNVNHCFKEDYGFFASLVGYGIKILKAPSVMKLTTGTSDWSCLGSGNNFLNVNTLIKVGSDYYIGVESGGVKKLVDNIWTDWGTGISSYTIKYLYDNGTDLYACTESHGIFKQTAYSGTWTQFGTGLNSATVFFMGKNMSDQFICSTNIGVYYLNDTLAWTRIGTSLSNVTSIVISDYDYYVSLLAYGVYKSDYYLSLEDIEYDIYIPNDDAIARLCMSSATLSYVVANVNLSSKSVKALKLIDSFFTNDKTRIVYSVCATNNRSIDVYVISKTGDGTYRESATIGTQCISSATIANSFTYDSFVGMSLLQNKMYEINVPSIKGYSLITCYDVDGNSKFDVIDFTVGSSSNTITMERMSVGTSIPNTAQVGYIGTTQTFIVTTKTASLSNNNNKHYIYGIKGMKLIRYTMTGNQMQESDITEITEIYNSEISPFSDPEGLIAGCIVSNSKEYIQTEINKSKKTPIRPYFSADVGNVLYSTTAVNSYEIHTQYEMVATSGSLFRTPIDIDGGTQVVLNDDSQQNSFLYWIFYLMNSGLLDSYVPYILLSKGTKDSILSSYILKFWSQDKSLMKNVYPDMDESQYYVLPYRFNNLNISANDNDVYLINGKLFFKHGDSERDLFSVDAFWQTSNKVLFEIQDLTISPVDLMCAINYEKKSLHYSTGYKYLNLYNSAYFNSKPTAIQEINNNIIVIVCENDIYIAVGTSEDNLVISFLASNIGLEKDNFKSLIGNGQQAFIYNKKNVWMINTSGLTNIGKPIEQYLYHRTAGNVLGVDTVNGNLYIPLDISKMSAITTILKTGDYGVSSDTTITFNKAFAVFNYNELSYTIYAYQDNLNYSYDDFISNLNEHLIARVGNKIIIPEFSEEDGTEQKIGRFTTKRISFGNIFSLKKLDTLLFQLINNANISQNVYGCDYIKIKCLINNQYTYIRKYGDFDENQIYECYVSDIYKISEEAPDSVLGISQFKAPLGLDFNDIEVTIEFGRLSDTNQTITTLHQISMDVINEESEKDGII